MYLLVVLYSRASILSPLVQRFRKSLRNPGHAYARCLLRVSVGLTLLYCNGCPSQPFLLYAM